MANTKDNKKKGFKVICQECGNEIEIKDGFDRSGISIYMYADSWGDISLDCEKCNKNEIDSK